MTDESIIPQSRRRQVGRYKVKQADGVVTKCASRVAKSGSQAHSFYIGDDQFSIFTADELSPVTVGDRVRFDYEIRHLRSGYRNQYFAVIPETLAIYAPSELAAAIEGNVYILSNATGRLSKISNLKRQERIRRCRKRLRLYQRKPPNRGTRRPSLQPSLMPIAWKPKSIPKSTQARIRQCQ